MSDDTTVREIRNKLATGRDMAAFEDVDTPPESRAATDFYSKG